MSVDVEQLLADASAARLSGAARTASDELLIIDPETRQIAVPENFLLGVESDQNVERVRFQCPKIVGDNIDLSKLHIYVNYQNANQEVSSYWCQDVEVEGDNITFSWLVSRAATMYQGETIFIVCAKKSDEEGNLTNEWNTTIPEHGGIVLEGLEPDPRLEQQYPDVIEQILTELDTIKIPAGGTTGQVLTKKSDADYDVEWTTIKNTGTVEPPSKEDTLLGALPYKITESNCYIISETEAQITTGEGAENLYIRNGEYLVGNPEGVEWGVDSLKYTPVDNLVGVYTHAGESNSFKPNTKYTLFADFESKAAPFIRVFAKSDDTNPFLGHILGQLNGNGSGYLTFTTSEDIKWLNLGFGFIVKGTGKFYNIAIYEGEYTERPKGGTFTLPANTKFNTDAYIGSTLSPVNEEIVSVYKANTEDSENETNKGGVIFFGDSIFDYSGVADMYSEKTGKPVLDCSVGGTRLSGSRDSENEYYPYDMTNIADAISSGDFSSQVNGNKNPNFSILRSGNISAYKTMVLQFGTNDFTAKVPFNGEGVESIEGAIKHILTTILTKYPTMRIVVFSTLHYVTAGKGEESGVPTHTDGTVWQMNEVIKSICESDDYCVPFVDMYHLFTENKLTRDILTSDGVHLSSSYGAPRYADIMTAQLNSIGV